AGPSNRGYYPTMLWAALCITAILAADVRFGSKADIAASPTNVRFTPKSGHWNLVCECPLCAKSGHRRGPARFSFVGFADGLENPRFSPRPSPALPQRHLKAG